MRINTDHYAAAFLGLGAVLILGCGDSSGPPRIIPSTTGAIRITATTVGVDLDPDGYDVQLDFGVDQSMRVRVPNNGTITFNDLVPRDYRLTIFDVVPNCNVAFPSPRTVAVEAGPVTQVALDVTCATPTQLAFVAGADSDAEIFVVNSNGAGISRITTQPGADVNPAWSPDGSRIAFASKRDGNFEIYVMDATGANPVRLTNASAADSLPAWSPDGARIAFVSQRDGNAEIYVMNADGTNLVRLTSDDANEGDPAWSPDGNRIAFVSNREGNAQVYVMNADGSGGTRISFDRRQDLRPTWSPDGTRIAFSRGDSYDSSNIYLMNADGSGVARLTQFSQLVSNGFDPAWSPDGHKIALTTMYCDFYYDYCYHVMQVVRTDGIPFVLTIPETTPSEPTWRP